jgi:hypothetical protein
MEGTYLKALELAISDLRGVDKELELLERKRAKLRQTIKTLRSLLGTRSTEDQTITEVILEIVKAEDGYVAASEVMERIDMAGYVASAPTVATTLSRLVKEKQLEKGPEGGYRWAGIPKWAEQFGNGVAESFQGMATVSAPPPNSLAAMDADGRLAHLAKPPAPVRRIRKI